MAEFTDKSKYEEAWIEWVKRDYEAQYDMLASEPDKTEVGEERYNQWLAAFTQDSNTLLQSNQNPHPCLKSQRK